MYENTFKTIIRQSLDDAVLEMALSLNRRRKDFYSPHSIGRRLRRVGFDATDKDIEDSLIYHELRGHVRECEDRCGRYLISGVSDIYLSRN